MQAFFDLTCKVFFSGHRWSFSLEIFLRPTLNAFLINNICKTRSKKIYDAIMVCEAYLELELGLKLKLKLGLELGLELGLDIGLELGSKLRLELELMRGGFGLGT